VGSLTGLTWGKYREDGDSKLSGDPKQTQHCVAGEASWGHTCMKKTCERPQVQPGGGSLGEMEGHLR
jgi:hypothetical protein